jgi:membrane-bound serine protease (ClpP class)
MKKMIGRLAALVAATLCLFALAGRAQASAGEVVLLEVTGEVNAAMTAYIGDAINSAEAAGSPVVLVLDTYGGQILEADNIKNILLNATVPVSCYITRNALSAGTLIAISCERIIMAPGAVIGAAETIPNDEKTVSTWVGILTSAAEARGRDTQVVAAMADKDIAIEGVTEAGSLLTLGAAEAGALHISDGTAQTQDEALSLLGYAEYTNDEQRMSFPVLAAQFLTSTSVMSILFIAAIICMGIEIFTPGFGVFGVLSIICFALYFGGSYIAGYAEWWSIALFVAGVVLLGIEIAVPGFGIFGILGILCIVAGMIFAARDFVTFLTVLGVGIVGAGVGLPLIYLLLKKLGLLRRLALEKGMLPEEGYASHEHTPSLVGKTGAAMSDLRPAGIAAIDGGRQSVVSSGEYIEKGTAVVVVEHTPGRVVVEEIKPKQ